VSGERARSRGVGAALLALAIAAGPAEGALAASIAARSAEARAAGSYQQATATSITVRVEGVEGSEGLLRVSLFQTADGFPERFERAARTASLEPAGPTADVVFDDVTAGDWAVAVLHDENRNEKLDRNFLGIPREGVGASNDAVRLGLPKFERARVQVPAEGATVVVKLKYWL
jgi:uncharacterized protein (DUF2141 family)